MREPFLTLTRYRTLSIYTWTIFELLLAVFCCTLVTWYIKLLWSKRKIYRYASKLPGPLALPIIGSALSFVGSPYDIFLNVMRMFREYPGIFRVWYGTKIFYAISDPKYYEILLPSCLQKDHWYDYTRPIVGQGLLTAPFHKWKRHRKIIMPTFNPKMLNSFVEIYSQQSQILVEEMKKVAGKGEVDVFGLVYNCTLDIICETAMGVKVNIQTRADIPIHTWVDRILEVGFLRCFVMWYHVEAIFNMTSMSKEFYFFVKKFHDFCGKIVRDRKRSFDESKLRDVDFAEEDYEEGTRKKAFLDHLLNITSEGSSKFTEEELKEEVITFIIAGSDTTAVSNSFVLVMLGLHKDLQEKVYEEVIEIIGPTRPVEPEDLPKLKLLDRFIKETLRLFPVGPVILRAIEEDVDLGDQVVPAGVSVIFGILRTHTNEEYWPDPYKFDPDRFLPEEMAKRHPCAYLPFSYGPRNCIGMKYATMAMKALIATVVRQFRIGTSYKSVQDIELKSSLVLRPKNGHKVSLELR